MSQDTDIQNNTTPELDLENLEEEDSEQFELYPDTSKPDNTGSFQVPRNPDGTIMKGYSLNPKGKPKGAISFASVLRKIALEQDKDAPVEYNPDGSIKKRTSLEIVTRKLIELAKAGDMQAIKEFTDRLDGKARQSIQVDTNQKVRFNPADYAEMAKLWFRQADDGIVDEENEEEVEPEKSPAQAMADKPAELSKSPDYEVPVEPESENTAHAV